MEIGAHYYPWYNTKKQWQQRTVRSHLHQVPILDWYTNQLTFPINQNWEIVKQHFTWCKQYGIDFLLISWKDHELLPYLDLAEQIGIKIAIHYETLGKARHHTVKIEHLPTLLFDVPRIKEWFNHPAWYRINGKPVVAYYVARQINGRDHTKICSELRKSYGEIFLLADEVWWHQPNPSRLKCYDGIFGYNMYINQGVKMDKGRVHCKGETEQQYLQMIAPYEQAFADVCHDNNLLFFPTALPGYNDRAVRLDQDHYVLPRQQGEFFKQYLDHARSFAHDGYLLITSFNEWYEDTQIEPTAESDLIELEPPYGTGQRYEGYGFKYLEILRDFKEELTRPPQKPLAEVEEFPSQQVQSRVAIDPTALKLITLTQNVLDPVILNDKQLIDYCAILQMQVIQFPILDFDNDLKTRIQQIWVHYTKVAKERSIHPKVIKNRVKQLIRHTRLHQDELET